MSNFRTTDIKSNQIEQNILTLRIDMLNAQNQLKQTLEEKISNLKEILEGKISNLESIFFPDIEVIVKNLGDLNGRYVYIENVFAFFNNDSSYIDLEHDKKRSIFFAENGINSIIIYSNNGWLIVKYDYSHNLNKQHFVDINSNIGYINNIAIIRIYELTTSTHERSRDISMPAPNHYIE